MASLLSKKKYDDQNIKTLGVLHICLSTGIWDQVKKKSAAKTWAWLCAQYSVQQFVKILEDFKSLINFKLDLSDPDPQIADFQSYYSRLSKNVPIINQSIACFILILALSLFSDLIQKRETLYISKNNKCLAPPNKPQTQKTLAIKGKDKAPI
jgi:hypothetical protein